MNVATQIELLRRYPRAIYHMRAQLAGRKLIPVFGAGTSQSIGLPSWSELVSRIADHQSVGARQLASGSSSQASRIQLIFHHFKRGRMRDSGVDAGIGQPETTVQQRRIDAEWRLIVHECLYRDALPVDRHPYLKSFLGVVRKAPLTVNYNFDDSIQELLDKNRVDEQERGRGFETVWDPTVQF